jgi:hypothetical protein
VVVGEEGESLSTACPLQISLIKYGIKTINQDIKAYSLNGDG